MIYILCFIEGCSDTNFNKTTCEFASARVLKYIEEKHEFIYVLEI